MPVSITWSESNGGVGISSLSHGNGSAGSTLTAKTIYLRHSGVNQISNVRIYAAQKAATYTGAATAAADFNEIISWGDSNIANGFGGLQFNFNATGGFPGASWPSVSSKSPSNGENIRTGVGDTNTNGVFLPTATGCPSVGVIPAGGSPNVRFQLRFKIPTNEGTLGARQIDLRIRYTFTS